MHDKKIRLVPAYLIAIVCDKSHRLTSARIWSSPEWQQSRQIPDCHTYVAYSVMARTFQDGTDRIKEVVADSRSRYHYLSGFLAD